MSERIERVMRIKRMRFNNDELFERRRGFDDREQEGAFASVFEEAVEKKKNQQSKGTSSDCAYRLDVGRPTQSLFYQGKGNTGDSLYEQYYGDRRKAFSENDEFISGIKRCTGSQSSNSCKLSLTLVFRYFRINMLK